MTRVAALLAPPGDSKLVRSLRARRGLVARLQSKSRAVRDPSRPLVWLHAPSVGEGLQARPVAQALRAAHPEWQLAYTFFSPSAERFAGSIGADITDYLPFDRAADADALLDALSPSLLVFAKLDVWPVLVERAVTRGVPVALVSATLAASSGRLGWWSRQLVGDAYASLRAVGAIDADNAERLIGLGVPRQVLRVTGDTRFDQVHARAQAVDRHSALLSSLASARPTLVAGSTWPADEAVLFAAWAFAACRGAAVNAATHHRAARAHAGTLCARSRRGRTARRSASCDSQRSRAAVRRTTPMSSSSIASACWAMLYALADCAFVGGGFHSAGLHSVIEPAAFGVPVAFGPRHDMSREAGLLLAAGGAHAARDADELGAQLRVWMTDEARRKHEGAAARAVVEQELGATAKTVRMIEELMGSRTA